MPDRAKIHLSINTILMRIIVVIALVEASIMLVFASVELEVGAVQGAMLDAFLLSFISAPFIYFWIIRPFIQAHEDVHQSLVNIKLAVDQHSVIATTDIKGTITEVNDKFCEISGYTEDELIGQNHRLLNSGNQDKAYWKNMYCTVAKGQVWKDLVINKAKDGHLYWVNTSITPIMGKEGKPVGYIAIRTDVTNQKLAEHALIEAREAAEHANQAKSEFLSSMSHELRTPMNAILGFAQLLEYDDNLEDGQKENVQEILKAGDHLLNLINEVLNLAKIESGHVELSLEPVELLPLIEECLGLVKPLAEKHNIQISHQEQEAAVVRADNTRLKQSLLNLLSNAIKYNRDSGSIKIQVQPSAEGRLRIDIRDTGVGIAAERLGELFQPFNRLGAENSGIEGTGIGLTFTRCMVELMGGVVDLETEEGVGSTFWIELPAEALEENEEQHQVTSKTTSPARAQVAAQHKMLYIEDNPANLKLVTQILGQRQHIHLLTAHTPELGIELALSHQPELILLDINLPGMSGYQVLEKFKSDVRLKNVPVIAVTANAMSRDIEKGKAAGFFDYLAKPLDIAKFLEIVDHTLLRHD